MKIENRTIYADDCLDVLNDDYRLPNNSVDLIYLDPPFNSKSVYNLPFKGHYKKDSRPVMAFNDTWSWSDNEVEWLETLRRGGRTDQTLADMVELARTVHNERPNSKLSIGAYLLNMAIRLKPMRRILKDSGSLYLHCDPTASHYLKMLLDAILGAENFRNEIVWCYAGGGVPKRDFPRKHDVIFRYAKKRRKFNVERREYGVHAASGQRATDLGGTRSVEYNPEGTPVNDWWSDVKPLINWHKERLGYPTQKPLSLMERILRTSTDPGDVVLDPFCGCGTTVHAAEDLGRQWVGIDISQFSTGLIKNRLLEHFKELTNDALNVIGVPQTIKEAENLFKSDPFEFEKWACGAVGAEGMFHPPGARGADGGIDGVIRFPHTPRLLSDDTFQLSNAIVQVKGGRVSPDSVRALSQSVEESGAKCGVFICFKKYMSTVENNRKKGKVKDVQGDFNYIQGLSVEEIVRGKLPDLPGFRQALAS